MIRLSRLLEQTSSIISAKSLGVKLCMSSHQQHTSWEPTLSSLAQVDLHSLPSKSKMLKAISFT